MNGKRGLLIFKLTYPIINAILMAHINFNEVSLMHEEIKDIIGYEGRYQVTSLGRIIALPNRSNRSTRDLKADYTKSKSRLYARVSLCINGKVTRIGVHRLVCQAFHVNPDNKTQVNHINNDTLNNIADNLEWCTPKENMKHSSDQGRQVHVQYLGTTAAAKANEIKAIATLNGLLGDNLIDTMLKYSGTKRKRFVTYRCKYCQNIHTKRLDSISIYRGGVCSDCAKDEDIVLTA